MKTLQDNCLRRADLFIVIPTRGADDNYSNLHSLNCDGTDYNLIDGLTPGFLIKAPISSATMLSSSITTRLSIVHQRESVAVEFIIEAYPDYYQPHRTDLNL